MTTELNPSRRQIAAPLTVADCLEMPFMREATVEAGIAGLQRTVRWVHPVDVPNIEECVVGGELIMTSGISLGHDRGLQRRIVPVMQELNLAGLVVALGPYVQHIPEAILEDADDRGIPIMSVPWAINFRDITQTILTEIVDRQYAMLEQSIQNHRGLTELVLEGGGLPELADRLSGLLQRTVVVLDPSFRSLAATVTASVGLTTRALMAWDRTGNSAADRLRSLATLRTDRGPIEAHIIDTDEERGVIAPIMVERQLHGYLWVDGVDGPFLPHDLVAVEHGATVAALLLYKDEAVRHAAHQQERDIVDRLLDGGPLDPSLVSKAERLLQSKSGYLVLVASCPERDPLISERMAEVAVRQVESAAHVRRRGGELLAIVPASGIGHLNDLIVELQELLRDGQGRVPVIGVGEVAPAPASIGDSYRAAREAILVGRQADQGATVHRAEQLRALRRVTNALTAADLGTSLSPISRLIVHDREHDNYLVDTLDIFLQHDGNATSSARALGVHRHTMLYRLDRIVEIAGVELTPATRLELRLGLLLHRLALSPE